MTSLYLIKDQVVRSLVLTIPYAYNIDSVFTNDSMVHTDFSKQGPSRNVLSCESACVFCQCLILRVSTAYVSTEACPYRLSTQFGGVLCYSISRCCCLYLVYLTPSLDFGFTINEDKNLILRVNHDYDYTGGYIWAACYY